LHPGRKLQDKKGGLKPFLLTLIWFYILQVCNMRLSKRKRKDWIMRIQSQV
jgi:hypothetical protein